MLVFCMLWRITQSSHAHRTESVLAMVHEVNILLSMDQLHIFLNFLEFHILINFPSYLCGWNCVHLLCYAFVLWFLLWHYTYLLLCSDTDGLIRYGTQFLEFKFDKWYRNHTIEHVYLKISPHTDQNAKLLCKLIRGEPMFLDDGLHVRPSASNGVTLLPTEPIVRQISGQQEWLGLSGHTHCLYEWQYQG